MKHKFKMIEAATHKTIQYHLVTCKICGLEIWTGNFGKMMFEEDMKSFISLYVPQSKTDCAICMLENII